MAGFNFSPGFERRRSTYFFGDRTNVSEEVPKPAGVVCPDQNRMTDEVLSRGRILSVGFTKLVYFPILITVFPGGAMVARIPVKDKVVGSNPTRGAR